MANVTGDSASEVSSYMTAIWNNYAKGSENLEHFTDVMADLGARTASSSSEIADGLQQFVSLGPVIGLSFDNAAAALAAVSSSTRESAATIGNSFKTIFARLQGLKLGDTLDDGTDLNKYSQALATAGVQIKDSTGQLKDADIILDELMDKWDGLAKDQQVATAQTVAGVHQYARFMSLMEAKDAYRQNLQWAQNADGAVDEQMKYYEESWTAAQDRFKDSLNQVYNQLNIEDGAKTLYNVLDKVASGAAEAIENIGGIKPIFLALASFLGGTFSSQISNTFSRFKQNIITTITSEEQLKQAHQEMLNVIQEKKDSIGSVAIQKEIEGYEQLIQLKQKVANASKNLSSDEIAYNDAVLQSVEQLLLKEKELRELRVEKEDTYQDLPEDAFNNFAKTVKGGNILKGENGLGGANEERVSAFYNSRNVENNINASNEIRIRELIDNVLQLETANAQVTASFKRVEEAGKTFSSANEKDINKVRESYAKLLQDIKDDFPLLVEESKKADVDIVDSIESIATQSLEEIKKNIEETKRNLSDLRSNIQRSANLGGQALSGLNINPKKLREAAEEQVDIVNQQRETSETRQNLGKAIIEKPVKKDIVAQILKLNSALSQTAFAMMSVRSIWKDLSNPDISGWEKLTSVLMNIGFITPSILPVVKQLNNFTSKIGSVKAVGKVQDVLDNAEYLKQTSRGAKKVSQAEKTKSVMDDLTAEKNKVLNYASNKTKLETNLTDINKELEEITKKADLAQERLRSLQDNPYAAYRTAQNEAIIAQKEETEGIRESIVAQLTENETLRESALATGAATVAENGNLVATEASIAASRIRAAENAKEAVSEELVNIALSEGITVQNADIALKYKGVAATLALALMQGNLAVALEAVKAAYAKLSAFMVANPVVAAFAGIAAVIGSLYAAKTIIEAISDTAEKAEERLSDTGDWDEASQKVEDYKSKLSEVESKIEEIKSKGSLSLADSSDLTTLEAEKVALEAQAEAAERTAEARAKAWALKFEDDFETSTHDDRKQSVDTQIKLSNGDVIGKAYDGDVVSTSLQEALDAIDKYKAEGNLAMAQELQEKVTELFGADDEYADTLENFGKYLETQPKKNEAFFNAVEVMAAQTEEEGRVMGDLDSRMQNVSDIEGVQKYLDQLSQKDLDALSEAIENGASEQDIYNQLKDLGYDGFKSFYAGLTGAGTDASHLFSWMNQAIEEERNLIDNMIPDMTDGSDEMIDKVREFINSLSDEQIQGVMENLGDPEAIIQYLGLTDEKAKKMGYNSGLDFATHFAQGILDGKQPEVIEGLETDDKTKNKLSQQYDSLKNVEDKELFLKVVPTLEDEELSDFANKSTKEVQNYLDRYQSEQKAVTVKAKIETEIEAAKNAGDTYNFDTKDVENYAKQLQKLAKEGKITNKTLADNYDVALDVAFAYQKMNDGLEKIRSGWEDWQPILAKGSKNNSEWSNTFNDYAAQMEKVLDMQLQGLTKTDGITPIDITFLADTESLKLAEQALNGDADAVDRLKAKAQEKIFFEVYADEIDDSGMKEDLVKMANTVTNWVKNNHIEIGATIDDSQFSKALGIMAAASGQTAQQIASMFGFEIKGSVGYDLVQIDMSSVSNALANGSKIPSLDSTGLTAKQTTAAHKAGKTWVNMPHLTFATTSSAAGSTARIPKATGTSGSKNSGKSKGGGGGGGSSDKYEPDTLDDEFDKYYYYEKSIDDLAKAYDRLSAARDRAYDPKDYSAKTAQMNANLKAQLDVYKKYQAEVLNDLEFDKKYLTGLGAKFDSWGNMTNYKAFMENQKASFQMQLNKAGNDENAEKIKKRWEILQKKVEQWQNKHDTYADMTSTIEEITNEIIDNKLSDFQFELDVNTDKAEVALDHISSRLSHLDHYKLNVSLLVDAQEDELGEMLNKLEYQRHYLRQLNAEAATDGMNKNLQDAINEAKKNIDSLVTDIENKVDDIGNDIQKVFDDLDDRVDSTKNRLSSFGDILSNMKDIISLSGKKYTNNSTYNALQKTIEETNKNNISILKEQLKNLQDAKKYMEDARAELAAQGADEAVLKQWDDKIKEAAEQITSLGADLTSAIQESISTVMDAAVEALEDAMKKAEMKLFNIGDLEMAKNYYEEYQDLSEEYLDNTEKTYELGKLMRQINNSIADKNNVTGAKELAALADEVTKKQEKGVKLSQYDVDLLNAKYQLTLAQIALEEAQNNKTTMRLRRDASGNYSYVYTADADAISNAEQTVEDKQKNLYDISKEYEEKIAASWFDVLQQYEERVQELQEKYQAGIIDQTEFNKQKEALDLIYTQKIEYIYGELNKVYENSTLTFKDSNLQKATSMNELVDIYDKSNEFIKDISADATQNAQDQADAVKDILGSVGIEVDKLATTFNTANTDINNSITSMVASTKTSLADFNASLDTSIQKIKEYAAAASAAFGKTGDAYVATGDVNGFTGDLSKQYMNAVAQGDMDLANQLLEARAGKMAGMDANTLSSLISNERLQKWAKYYNNPDSAYYKAAQDMLDAVNGGASALQWWIEIMNKITKDNPYKGASSFDSGGYTGPWGSEGKLALLHEKELILNKTDTENILDAVNIIRSMSQSITSSLVSDLVNLVDSLGKITTNVNSSTEKVPQMVAIDASFPNVSVASEIEEAFNDLANQAAQFASIKRI